MHDPITPKKLALATAALIATLLPTRTRAANTLTWDADPAQPGVQGGPGTWADGAGGWFDGTANVTWNNANLDSALLAGTAGGTINLGTGVTTRYLTVDTPGYTLSGVNLVFGDGPGLDWGVRANADVTINAMILAPWNSDGWIKDGPGTLTLAGDNTSGSPLHLRSGTLAFASTNGANLPKSIVFDGDLTSRLLYTGSGVGDYIKPTLDLRTFARVDVAGAQTRLSLIHPIVGGGTLIKQGAGTLIPTDISKEFTGNVQVQAGTLLLTSAAAINKRPISLVGGTLALEAEYATDFGSPVTARLGTGRTATLSVGSATGMYEHTAHSLPSLSLISGTLSITSAANWALHVGALTNGATIDLNNTRLAVTSGPISPFANSPGTFRFAHDPSLVPGGTNRGLWINNGLADNALASTFDGQTSDADLLFGVSAPAPGTTATQVTLTGTWRGGTDGATSTLAAMNGAITFGPAFRINNLTADRTAFRPVRARGGTSSYSSTLVFDPAFVADRTNGGTVADGLGELQLSGLTWVTHDSRSLPAVTRLSPSGATHRAGLITFDNFSSPTNAGSAAWSVRTNDQTYDGGVLVKQNGTIALSKNLTLTGRVDRYADNQLRIAANRLLSVSGTGTLTLAGDLGFAPGSRLSGGTSLLVFNTDPGAGWYDGNYARDPATGAVLAPPAPAHTLKLSYGNLEGRGGAVFNAPVTRLAELSVGGTAVVSLSLPGPQKVVSVSSRLITYSSTYFTRFLDLTDNAMILGAGPYHTPDTVRPLLTAGALRSSAADAAHALGYARAADVLPNPLPPFLGLPVTADDVLVRYTLLGDANLDGRVNFSDLARLAQHYNKSTPQWSAGDFNYDGLVNFSDLAKLAQNYNDALPTAPIPGAPAELTADLAAAFAAAPVPEPSATFLAVTACGFALATRRRRRWTPR